MRIALAALAALMLAGCASLFPSPPVADDPVEEVVACKCDAARQEVARPPTAPARRAIVPSNVPVAAPRARAVDPVATPPPVAAPAEAVPPKVQRKPRRHLFRFLRKREVR